MKQSMQKAATTNEMLYNIREWRPVSNHIKFTLSLFYKILSQYRSSVAYPLTVENVFHKEDSVVDTLSKTRSYIEKEINFMLEPMYTGNRRIILGCLWPSSWCLKKTYRKSSGP